MLRERLSRLKDEDGTSMVEVMVGLAMGMVVLAGLSMLLIVTMHGNARISARTEASDNARVTMTRIMEELHSGCVSPTVAPVKSGSTKEKLIFIHGTYGGAAAASPTVTTSEIFYTPAKGTLSQSDNGGAPRVLLSHVSPPASGKFFEYKNPTVQEEAFKEPLSVETAPEIILVNVALKASPKSAPISDTGAATEVSNSATLRLTPPTYEEQKVAKPCE
jgi:hypothetical protein